MSMDRKTFKRLLGPMVDILRREAMAHFSALLSPSAFFSCLCFLFAYNFGFDLEGCSLRHTCELIVWRLKLCVHVRLAVYSPHWLCSDCSLSHLIQSKCHARNLLGFFWLACKDFSQQAFTGRALHDLAAGSLSMSHAYPKLRFKGVVPISDMDTQCILKLGHPSHMKLTSWQSNRAPSSN